MRVIVTRPMHEAKAWADALHDKGHDVQVWPLIDIAPPHDLAPVHHAWQQWRTWHAVMFVSAQAVRLFFAQRPDKQGDGDNPAADLFAAPPQPEPRCWATGLGTQRALLQAGVPASRIDAPDATSTQFDSETLWQRVHTEVAPGQSVLIVRGSDAAQPGVGAGRDWLGEQLQAKGVSVHWVAAYERRPPVWPDAQRAQAIAATQDGSIWLLSSSQALQHLQQLLPDATWHTACALVTHPRIAQAAQNLGFGRVMQARPVLADVLASLECPA